MVTTILHDICAFRHLSQSQLAPQLTLDLADGSKQWENFTKRPELLLPMIKTVIHQRNINPQEQDHNGFFAVELLLQQPLYYQDQALAITYLLTRSFPLNHQFHMFKPYNPLMFICSYPFIIHSRLGLINQFLSTYLHQGDIKEITLALVALATGNDTLIVTNANNNDNFTHKNDKIAHSSTHSSSGKNYYDVTPTNEFIHHTVDSIDELFDIIKLFINSLASIHLSKQPKLPQPLSTIKPSTIFNEIEMNGIEMTRVVDTTTIFPNTFFNAISMIICKILHNPIQTAHIRISITLYLFRTLFQFFPQRAVEIALGLTQNDHYNYQTSKHVTTNTTTTTIDDNNNTTNNNNTNIPTAIATAPRLTQLDRKLLIAPLRKYTIQSNYYNPRDGNVCLEKNTIVAPNYTKKDIRLYLSKFLSHIDTQIGHSQLETIIKYHFGILDGSINEDNIENEKLYPNYQQYNGIIDKITSLLIPSPDFLFQIIKNPIFSSYRIKASPNQLNYVLPSRLFVQSDRNSNINSNNDTLHQNNNNNANESVHVINPWPLFLFKLYLSRNELWVLDIDTFLQIMNGGSYHIETEPMIENSQVLQILTLLRFMLEYRSVTVQKATLVNKRSKFNNNNTKRVNTRQIRKSHRHDYRKSPMTMWDMVKLTSEKNNTKIKPKEHLLEKMFNSVNQVAKGMRIGTKKKNPTTYNSTNAKGAVRKNGQTKMTEIVQRSSSKKKNTHPQQASSIQTAAKMTRAEHILYIEKYIIALKHKLPLSLHDVRNLNPNPNHFNTTSIQKRLSSTLSILQSNTTSSNNTLTTSMSSTGTQSIDSIGNNNIPSLTNDLSSTSSTDTTKNTNLPPGFTKLPKSIQTTALNVQRNTAIYPEINLSPSKITYPISLALLQRFGRPVLPPKREARSTLSSSRDDDDSDSDDDDDDINQDGDPESEESPFPFYQHPLPIFFQQYQALYNFILSVYLPLPMDALSLSYCKVLPLKHPEIDYREQQIGIDTDNNSNIPNNTTNTNNNIGISTAVTALNLGTNNIEKTYGTLSFPQLLPKRLVPFILGHNQELLHHITHNPPLPSLSSINDYYKLQKKYNLGNTTNKNDNSDNRGSVDGASDSSNKTLSIRDISTLSDYYTVNTIKNDQYYDDDINFFNLTKLSLSLQLPLYSLFYYTNILSSETITTSTLLNLSIYRYYHQPSTNILNNRETWSTSFNNATTMVTPYQYTFLRPVSNIILNVIQNYSTTPDLNYPINKAIAFRGMRQPLLQSLLYSGIPSFVKRPSSKHIKNDPFNYKIPNNWDFHYMFIPQDNNNDDDNDTNINNNPNDNNNNNNNNNKTHLLRFLQQPKHIVNINEPDIDGLTMLARLILNPSSLTDKIRLLLIELLLQNGASPFVYGHNGVPLIHSIISYPLLHSFIPTLFNKYPTLALLYNHHGVLPLHLLCSIINMPYSINNIRIVAQSTPLDMILSSLRGRYSYSNNTITSTMGKSVQYFNNDGNGLDDPPSSSNNTISLAHIIGTEGYLSDEDTMVTRFNTMGYDGTTILHMMLGTQQHQYQHGYHGHSANTKNNRLVLRNDKVVWKHHDNLSSLDDHDNNHENTNIDPIHFITNAHNQTDLDTNILSNNTENNHNNSINYTKRISQKLPQPIVINNSGSIFGHLRTDQVNRIKMVYGNNLVQNNNGHTIILNDNSRSNIISFWDNHMANALTTLFDVVFDKLIHEEEQKQISNHHWHHSPSEPKNHSQLDNSESHQTLHSIYGDGDSIY